VVFTLSPKDGPSEISLAYFESGAKKFATAKTDVHFKGVVNEMCAACDEVIKVILKNNNKDFKHGFDKTAHNEIGINGHQKELFKKL
jgi:hypothetical protein